MTPHIILDSKGKVRITGGGSGGPHIITGSVQVREEIYSVRMSLTSDLITDSVKIRKLG
jgi:gamma-glutamyltranspeptidase